MLKIFILILSAVISISVAANEKTDWDKKWQDRVKEIKAMNKLEKAIVKEDDLYLIDTPYKRCVALIYRGTGRTETSQYERETHKEVRFTVGDFEPENGFMTVYKARKHKIDVIGRCKGFTPQAKHFLGGTIELKFDAQSFKKDKKGEIQEWEPNLNGSTCLDGSLILTSRGGFDMECSLSCTRWLEPTPRPYMIVRGWKRAQTIAKGKFNGSCIKTSKKPKTFVSTLADIKPDPNFKGPIISRGIQYDIQKIFDIYMKRYTGYDISSFIMHRYTKFKDDQGRLFVAGIDKATKTFKVLEVDVELVQLYEDKMIQYIKENGRFGSDYQRRKIYMDQWYREQRKLHPAIALIFPEGDYPGLGTAGIFQDNIIKMSKDRDPKYDLRAIELRFSQ